MTAVSVPGDGTPTKLIGTFSTFAHVYNNSTATIYLCYDGSTPSYLTVSNGLPVLPNVTYAIEISQKQFNIPSIYACQNSGNPADVRVQSA